MSEPRTAEHGSGAIHLGDFLSLVEQRELVRRSLDLGARPAGFYSPTVRSGGTMSLRMMCLGRHWNARTYRYEATRSDHDGLPVQELPADLAGLARRTAAAAGMAIEPDICLVNLYPEGAKLGLHQDRDESPESLAAGIPVVSLSLGDTAEFLLGGLTRKEPIETIELRSGDAFVFGGPSRLRFHGVAKVLPKTAPAELGLEGRLSLTFRQS